MSLKYHYSDSTRLRRTAHNREAAALQEKLRNIQKERDEALRRAEDERKMSKKLAQMAQIISKLPKDPQDTSDDSAIIEDEAPDGQSSNSDPSPVVIVRGDQQHKVCGLWRCYWFIVVL